jgi:hypothetical protein
MPAMSFRWRSTDRSQRIGATRPRRPVAALVEPLERRSLLAQVGLINGLGVSATQGAEFSGPVASFFSLNPFVSPSDFKATIDWGDQAPATSGTVTPNGLSSFNVDGVHTYGQSGVFTTTITIKAAAGGSTLAQANGTAQVAPTPIQVFTLKVSAAPGQPIVNKNVANFVATNPAFHAGDFSAYVAWGDGAVSPGVIGGGTSGVYSVTSSRTPGYSSPGTYTFNVVVTNKVTNVTASATGQATVAAPVPVSPIKAVGTTFPVVPGVPLNNVVVATFSDTNPAANAGNITAVIDWGNGRTSLGTVNPAATPGSFTVTGSFTYATAAPGGSFPVTVTISDPGGLSSTAKSTALVANTITGVGFSGGLAPASTRGPLAGVSNTNRPIFAGTAPPFSIVELYARHSGIDATLPLGKTVASAAGNWGLQAGPMAAGAYVVTATIIPPNGYPSAMTPLSGGGLILIDPSPQVFVFHRPSRGPGHRPARPHHHATRPAHGG